MAGSPAEAAAQKAINRPGLVERKVCFISGGSNCRGGWQTSRAKANPPPPADKQGVRAFIDRVGGGGAAHAETAQSSLNSFRLVISGSPGSSIILVVVCTVNLPSCGLHWFPFLCGQFSELWQPSPGYSLVSVQVNFSTWCFGIYKTALRIHSELRKD